MSSKRQPTLDRPKTQASPSPATSSGATTSKKGRASIFVLMTQSILALVVGVFALEAFLSYSAVGQQEILYPDPQLGCRHIPGKLVTWRFEGFSHDRFSSAGLRDVEHTVKKPEGTYRIALLGDSATEGLQVSLQETYARLLEEKLNNALANGEVAPHSLLLEKSNSSTDTGPTTQDQVAASTPKNFEVINFGCSSYSTGQEYVYYKKTVSQYQPDLVVVLYSKGDSIENVTNPNFRKHAEPRPYFYLNDNGKLSVDIAALSMNSDKLHPSEFEKFLRAKSCIWGVFSQANLALMLNEKGYRKIRGWTFKALDFVSGMKDRKLLVNHEAETLPAELGLADGAVEKIPSYPEPDKLEVTEAILNELGDSVRADGGELALMMFPQIVSVDGEYTNQVKRIQALSQARGYGFLDLTPAVGSHPKPNSLFLAYHFSRQGHELVASQLAEYLCGARPQSTEGR